MSRTSPPSYVEPQGRLALCIEGGGTHSRGSLYSQDEDEELASAAAGCCNPSTNFTAAVESVRGIWAQIEKQTGADSRNVHLVLGCAGLVPADVRSDFIAAYDQFAQTSALSDGYASLVGAGGGKPCGMIVAGTGCAGHRMRSDGTSLQRDGWGWVGGDRGSGAWIGLRAVRRALCSRDGLLPGEPLVDEVLAELGSSSAEMAAWLTTCQPRDVAAFARHVFKHAEQGSEYAAALLERAAGHLRALFASLECEPDEPLFLSGSIATALADRIAAGMEVKPRKPELGAVEGCRLVAFGVAPLEWS